MKFVIGIIAGALLVIFAFKGGFINKDELKEFKTEADNIVTEVSSEIEPPSIPDTLIGDDRELSCAVQLDSISMGDTVTFPLLVEGTITPTADCPWVKFEGQGGVIYVKDSAGNNLSDAMPIVIDGEWMNLDPFNFSETLSLTTPTAEEVVFLYFQDANQAEPSENKTKVFIVPVKI